MVPANGHEGPVRAEERRARQAAGFQAPDPIWLKVRSVAGARIGREEAGLAVAGEHRHRTRRRLADQVGELVARDVTDGAEVGEASSSPLLISTPAPNVPLPMPGRSTSVSPASSRVIDVAPAVTVPVAHVEHLGGARDAQVGGHRLADVRRARCSARRRAGCPPALVPTTSGVAAPAIWPAESLTSPAAPANDAEGRRRSVPPDLPVRIARPPVGFERTTTSPTPSPVRSRAPPTSGVQCAGRRSARLHGERRAHRRPRRERRRRRRFFMPTMSGRPSPVRSPATGVEV